MEVTVKAQLRDDDLYPCQYLGRPGILAILWGRLYESSLAPCHMYIQWQNADPLSVYVPRHGRHPRFYRPAMPKIPTTQEPGTRNQNPLQDGKIGGQTERPQSSRKCDPVLGTDSDELSQMLGQSRIEA